MKVVKNDILRVRLSVADKETLRRKATDANMTISNYVRYCTVGSGGKDGKRGIS